MFWLWIDVLFEYFPMSICHGLGHYLNVPFIFKSYYPNVLWPCTALNCDIIAMRFGIAVLSHRIVMFYPNYRISWSLGAAETGEAAVWARNLMSTIKQFPVMYHLSTLPSKKKKELSCFKIYCLPLPKEFLGGVDAGQVYLRINWKLSKIILLILFFHPVNKLSFKSAPP